MQLQLEAARQHCQKVSNDKKHILQEVDDLLKEQQYLNGDIFNIKRQMRV